MVNLVEQLAEENAQKKEKEGKRIGSPSLSEPSRRAREEKLLRNEYQKVSAEKDALEKEVLTLRKTDKKSSLFLPVTKIVIEREEIKIDPIHCRVSPLNKRIQSLLTLNDPEIKDLFEKIRTVGQRDHVLVRPIVDEFYTHELIYGSRRRFCVQEINKARKEIESSKPVMLLAWCAQVPDEDVEYLSDSENTDRKDISPYEKAIFFKSLKDAGKTQDEIKYLTGKSQSTISETLGLLEIDLDIILLLKSPSLLTKESGKVIKRNLKVLSSKQKSEFVNKHAKNSFAKSSELANALKAQVKKNKSIIKAGKTYGDNRAKLTNHRTNKGQIKIDVFGVTDEEIQKIDRFLKDVFSK